MDKLLKKVSILQNKKISNVFCALFVVYVRCCCVVCEYCVLFFSAEKIKIIEKRKNRLCFLFHLLSPISFQNNNKSINHHAVSDEVTSSFHSPDDLAECDDV